MRYLVFSDIHGNLEALLALLKFAARKKIDEYICLGDLVGYGASPNEVIERVRELKPLSIIRGNHDKAVCDLDAIQTFNPVAAAAIHWTHRKISKRNLEFLCRLKRSPLLVQDDITICHGAPFDEDYYIFGEFDAAEAFKQFRTQICFFGHTHFPYVYTQRHDTVEGSLLEGNSNELRIEKDIRYLINPGSVGQPRDRNNRAAFAIYESETKTIRFHRIEYDILEAQKKIRQEKLPNALAERLSLGI